MRGLVFRLVKDDHKVTVREMTSREVTVIPGPKSKVTPKNGKFKKCEIDIHTHFLRNAYVNAL